MIPATRTHPTSYQDALAWLYAQTRGGLPRDPERTRSLLEHLRLDMPPQSVHVVGTNGKGTVTAMIAAALAAAGMRSGRFISPHVEDFRERITVDGTPISQAEVLAFVQRVADRPPHPAPAFFELTYAMALEHFAYRSVERAVIEAGVGARYDATITLENVRGVVITSIDLDHLDTLGPTLRDIARDKADAIRPGVPTITAVTGEALEVVAAVASERRSPLFIDMPKSKLFALPGGQGPLCDLDPAHRQNARLAAAALRIIGDVPEGAILSGLKAPRLPARAEVFHLKGRKVVLDGAHNPTAARALRAMLREPYVLVFGALPKKLGEKTLAALEPDALRTLITQADGQPSNLARTAGRLFIPDPLEALEQALDSCPPEACVVVAGSLYLAGQARPYLKAHDEAPQPVG